MKLFQIISIITALLFAGCDKSEENNNDNNNPPPDDISASGTVSSDSGGVIETSDGARITVPRGAVPLTTGGGEGHMIFSIEKLDSVPSIPNLPAGMTQVGDAYRFGPAGFVFETPVEVAVPLAGDYLIGEVVLARLDPTTGEAELYSTDFYPDDHRTLATTYEMSVWTHVRNAIDSELRAWGSLFITNEVDDAYAVLCVENFTATYPEDENFSGLRMVLGPNNWLNWATIIGRTGYWSLPQGTYSFCIEFMSVNDAADRRSATVSEIVIDNPDGWVLTRDLMSSASFHIVQEHYGSATPNERCGCNPLATPSVGTGDVQVTLTWHNELALDLDLWVTDPNDEVCNYANNPSSSGGILDIDNLCSNYVNGRPENIYWPEGQAPAGEYLVEVDWYSACSNTIASQTFSVRVVAGDNAETVEADIAPDETVQVATFNVGGGTVVVSPQIVARAQSGYRVDK